MRWGRGQEGQLLTFQFQGKELLCGRSALTHCTEWGGGAVVLDQRNPPFRERLTRYLTAHRTLGACCYPTFFSGKEQHNCSGTDENLGPRPSAPEGEGGRGQGERRVVAQLPGGFQDQGAYNTGNYLGDAVPSTAGHGPHEGGPSEKSWLRRPRAEHPVSATGVQLTQGLGAATQAP